MESPARTIDETELLENLTWVQALARRLVSDPASAEDLVQDTWVAALERPPRQASGAGMRAWLSRVVRTLAWKRSQLAGSRALRERASAKEEATASAYDVLARVAMQQRIVEAVVALDEPERTTVLLRYFDGLNARQIADRRGESPEAVRKRLSRAMIVLRGRLEREFGGDRNGLIHALTPLAFAGGGKATVPTLGILGGGVLVAKTTLAIGIGAAAVVIGAVLWFVQDGEVLEPRGKASVEAADAQLPAVDDGVPLPAADAIEVARQEVGLAADGPDTAVVVEVRTLGDEAPVSGVSVRLRVSDEDAHGDLPKERTTDGEGQARFPLRYGTRVDFVHVRAGDGTAATMFRPQRWIEGGREERIVVHVSAGGSVSGVVV